MLSVPERFSYVFNGVLNAWLLQRHLTKLLCAVLQQPSTINCLVKRTTKDFCSQFCLKQSSFNKTFVISLIVAVAAQIQIQNRLKVNSKILTEGFHSTRGQPYSVSCLDLLETKWGPNDSFNFLCSLMIMVGEERQPHSQLCQSQCESC